MIATSSRSAVAEPRAILRVDQLSKSFEGMRALSSVSMTIETGEIRVLVGQNGSGKSTLIKVLSGYHQPDGGGSVLIDSEPLTFGSADNSYKLGCRFVHQDLGLVDTRSVLDNLCLGSGYRTRFGTIRRRSSTAVARDALQFVGLDLDPDKQVSALAPSEKTAVAVARALRRDDEYPAKLLVLDEPTATLPYNDVNTLLDTVRAVADRGVAVMFVTHHLDEVFRLGDATTILRDGEVVGTYQLSEIDRSVLVEKLTGSAHELATPAVALSAGPSDGARHLAVRGLTAASLADIDISADAGEVIGIAGITGSGRESILGAIFGALPRDGGTVELDGTTIPRGRPDRAIAAGMAFLPADRANDSGILSLSATDNLTLSDLRPAWAGGRLIRRRQWTEATKWFTDLDVRPRDGIRQLLSSFSGGNQQKILLGKWLRLTPKVLLLDEPTQGVDIAAKAEIHRLIAAAAREGAAVLVASTDIEELGTLCSRVLILRQGRIAEELTGSSVGVPNITHAFMSDVASTTHEGGEIRGE